MRSAGKLGPRLRSKTSVRKASRPGTREKSGRKRAEDTTRRTDFAKGRRLESPRVCISCRRDKAIDLKLKC